MTTKKRQGKRSKGRSKSTSRSRKSSVRMGNHSTEAKPKSLSTGNGKNGKKKVLSVEEIVAWAEYKAGVPPKQTQASIDVSERTYYRYIENVETALDGVIGREELRKSILLVFPLAFQSLINLLKENHAGITKAYFVDMLGLKQPEADKPRDGDTLNIFGDLVINEFADKTLEARRKEIPDSGSRLKAFRLSDTGDIIPS